MPLSLSLGPLTTLSAGLGQAPRLGKGINYRPARKPEKPIELWVSHLPGHGSRWVFGLFRHLGACLGKGHALIGTPATESRQAVDDNLRTGATPEDVYKQAV